MPVFESEHYQFLHKGGGMLYVRNLQGKEIARVQSLNGKVTNIILKVRGVNKGMLFQEASDYITNVVGNVPTQTTGGQTMATKTAKTQKKSKTQKKTKAAVSKTPKKTATKKVVSKKLGPAIDAVDLTTGRDVPKTLVLLTKKTGGVGYCMCGCGAPVKKRFLPGHDSKLKKVLKGFSTENAKSVATELGWEKLIKWTK